MRTFRTQMPPPPTNRWQPLSRKTNRRRIAILSPTRIKKRITPLLKDLSRLWPSFANFFQDFPGIMDTGKAFKNTKTSEDRLDIFFGVLASEGKKN
ncbi:hypothetical protein TNCV_4327091 [Trichonephila clavipes]|nr:hypothetical protein TNCV_4327091 [Trichonephila clavipes]